MVRVLVIITSGNKSLTIVVYITAEKIHNSIKKEDEFIVKS